MNHHYRFRIARICSLLPRQSALVNRSNPPQFHFPGRSGSLSRPLDYDPNEQHRLIRRHTTYVKGIGGGAANITFALTSAKSLRWSLLHNQDVPSSISATPPRLPYPPWGILPANMAAGPFSRGGKFLALFRHKMYPAEDDNIGIGIGSLNGQLQESPHKIRQILNLRRLVKWARITAFKSPLRCSIKLPDLGMSMFRTSYSYLPKQTFST